MKHFFKRNFSRSDAQVRLKKFLINILGSFLKSLPDGKILELSKLKALAHNKLNETQYFKFVCHRAENV